MKQLCAAMLVMLAASSVRSAAPTWAVAVLPSGNEFSLEIAADDEARARGYMYREKIGPREGMLFIFERDDRHGFWMKNCRVPLDMIWLDQKLRVVHLLEKVPVCPADGPCPTNAPPQPARYVLELAAGTARAEKLSLGQTLVVLSNPPLR